MSYEYKVVPAPMKGVKAKGVKGAEAQFAHALSELMNSLAADGWEYQRADTLPSETRSGLTGKTTVFRNVLVFRRPLAVETDEATSDSAPLSVEKTVEINAPSLPSAQAAQGLPEAVKPLGGTKGDRDNGKVAAE